eukprot:TRINITY_DN380_c0_g1_i1.p1 TRINITY_DN380_c0_g1~~TRINITY_DN380_c0_g1_i1.p1  ORF type:complete len:206 (+),score=12.13 TRINITY_DN380_c0_g1_i1:64-681(+)
MASHLPHSLVEEVSKLIHKREGYIARAVRHRYNKRPTTIYYSTFTTTPSTRTPIHGSIYRTTNTTHQEIFTEYHTHFITTPPVHIPYSVIIQPKNITVRATFYIPSRTVTYTTRRSSKYKRLDKSNFYPNLPSPYKRTITNRFYNNSNTSYTTSDSQDIIPINTSTTQPIDTHIYPTKHIRKKYHLLQQTSTNSHTPHTHFQLVN